MNIGNMKPIKDSVTVTEVNLPTGVIFKNKQLLNNINCWHKFTVKNAENVSRNVLLRAILDHVHPLDLIPVAFGRDQFGSYFLARNCGAAIQKLCNDNLVVPNPNDNHPFKLNITLRFATTTEFKIDVQKNIITVLTKRFHAPTKTLHLNKFHEDLDLSEFCPLSQPKIMYFVLHLAKNITPSPEKVILSENRIRVLNPLEAISGMNSVVSLDLRNNLIDDVKALAPLKSFKIRELVLDGNPVCDKYDDETYINDIRSVCSHLEKLDGLLLKDGNFPVERANFFCDVAGTDLVSQFLEHYFTLYDSRNRRYVEEMYHKNAMFSLNTHYLPAQFSSNTADLRRYNMIGRNFKKMADMSRNSQYLMRGKTAIANSLCKLPFSEHDPYSFKVDLMHHTAYCAVIGITGVFRDVPDNLLDPTRIYGFKRTFVIEIVNGDHLCYIVNDMFHLYNALSSQAINAFSYSVPMVPELRPPQTGKEQHQLIDTLRIISGLNVEWSRKCLEETNYDLKRALALFVDLYKGDRIPKEGFYVQ